MIKNSKKRSRWVSLPLALILLLGTLLGASPAYANDVEAAGVSLTGQNTADGSTIIQFDIAWDNSWRDSLNWDAVWVFAKYQVADSGLWQHATLATEGHNAPAGAVIDVPSDGMGAFIYRAAEGGGSVDYDGVGLKWLYGTDGLADDAVVTVQLFAIEMVYIPGGVNFYVGDVDNSELNCFHDGGGTGPYLVTSSDAIPVGPNSGELYYDLGNDTSGDQFGPIPAEFPNGYDAFYMMRYEVSQRQWAAFLNTLTPEQKANRIWVENRMRYYLVEYDGVWGCDANENGILNEADDGNWLSVGWFSWMDGAAYSDWAGLRPMTELEYEKACRGNQEIVDNEYAWGSAVITDAVKRDDALTNFGMVNETGANTGPGLCNYDSDGSDAPGGPMRPGFAATDSTDRLTSGASYYGVMDLSGNGWELTVGVGTPQGRAYEGSHGDGTLVESPAEFAGNGNNSDWPLYTEGEGVSASLGSGTRGGCWGSIWYAAETHPRVSDRGYANWNHMGRPPHYGYRAVRTAETPVM